MAESSFRVVGLREAMEGTDAIAKGTGPLILEHIRKNAQAIVDVAQAIVPVKTGRLKDSIEVQGRGTGFIIAVKAPYAGYVEFGTSKMEARPYMQPAVNLVLSRDPVEIKKVMQEVGF